MIIVYQVVYIPVCGGDDSQPQRINIRITLNLKDLSDRFTLHLNLYYFCTINNNFIIIYIYNILF